MIVQVLSRKRQIGRKQNFYSWVDSKLSHGLGPFSIGQTAQGFGSNKNLSWKKSLRSKCGDKSLVQFCIILGSKIYHYPTSQ